MIRNYWREPPSHTVGLLELARGAGWTNLPLANHDVRVAWEPGVADVLGGTLLERHLPSRHYAVVTPTFESLVDALAWEAAEWIAVEIWRSRRKQILGAGTP